MATIVDYLSANVLSVAPFLRNANREEKFCYCRAVCKQICKALEDQTVITIVGGDVYRDEALEEYVVGHVAYDFKECGYVEEPDNQFYLMTEKDIAVSKSYGTGRKCIQHWLFKVNASIPDGKCYIVTGKTIKRRRGDGIIMTTQIILKPPLCLFRQSKQLNWLKNMN